MLECAAIGVPDEHSGEAVKVFVVKKDPTLTEEQVQQWCKDKLTGYKRPRYVEFRDELPKSNVGKILRRELRPDVEAAARPAARPGAGSVWLVQVRGDHFMQGLADGGVARHDPAADRPGVALVHV